MALPGAILAQPAAAESPGVVVNEISQRINPDWIEFLNVGSEPADISGWVLHDDRDRGEDNFVFAAGTVVRPGEHLVIDNGDGEGEFGFGLGAADEISLFDAEGVLIDRYEWSAHAEHTYGRCPDGVGDLRPTASPTRGEPNDCGSPVRLNEIVTTGDAAGDWVELHNPASFDADLSGFQLVSGTGTAAHVLTEGTVVPAGQFLVVDGADLPFVLGEEDSLRLLDGGGEVIDVHDWTSHAITSYGRCPDGVGSFEVTSSATAGAANDCEPIEGQDVIVLNEVVSTGGVPGDWVELINIGDADVDVSGWRIRDDDDHRHSVVPAGTVIPAGGTYVQDEALLGFGLGAEDEVRLYTPADVLVDEFSWVGHAPTSYGRCPDGAGEFRVTVSVTKDALNDCSDPVRLNEIVSGADGWIEIVNAGIEDADVSGSTLSAEGAEVARIPDGTVLPARSYLVLTASDLDVELSDTGSISLVDGEEVLDTVTWTEPADPSWGRCPDGNGAWTITTAATPGETNLCPGDVSLTPWPGPATVGTVDVLDAFTGDVSGLDHQASDTEDAGVLWAVDNGRGLLHRLLWNGEAWIDDAADGWADGKPLRLPDGSGVPDAEGVTVVGDDSVVVGVERDNASSSVSRNSLLHYDVDGGDASPLVARAEWNLTGDLPVVGANAGIEAVEWIADSALVEAGLVDDSTGEPYDPDRYGSSFDGVFAVGVEGTGQVYLVVLLDDGGHQRIATVDPLLDGVMALDHDVNAGVLWAVCDDGCDGTMARLAVRDGAFEVLDHVAPPAGLPNLNNEGFAIAPAATCQDGLRAVHWSDDDNTDGHALRQGWLPCRPDVEEPTEEPTDGPTEEPTTDGPSTEEPTEDSTGDSTGDAGQGGPLPSTGAPVAAVIVALGALVAGGLALRRVGVA